MNIIFTESVEDRVKLLPLTYTRPIADIRVGILKIAEKWIKCLHPDSFSFQTEDYLQNKFPLPKNNKDTLWINSGIIPNNELVQAVMLLQTGESLISENRWLVYRGDNEGILKKIRYDDFYTRIEYPWHIFQHNGQEIRNDFTLLVPQKKSQPLNDPYTKVYGKDLFIEVGASIRAAIINTETGPVYIGKDAEIHEGAIIRGPFALGEHSVVGMGCKVRGDTTVGPYSKIGGEVSNSVIFGYSNKAHDGYLGNAVIGEWCNLGAGTSNSNLKNTYAKIKMWDYSTNNFEQTPLQFCGLIMGDYSKSAINTSFNTGTSVGISTNIFGEGFPRQIIPSFSWGGSRGLMTYAFDKAIEAAQLSMERRRLSLEQSDIDVLKSIFEQTSQLRLWEKQNR